MICWKSYTYLISSLQHVVHNIINNKDPATVEVAKVLDA